MKPLLSQWARDGRLYAVLAAAGFSLKAVFVKLGYAAGPVDVLTLLALRMGIALPLFAWLAWLGRGESQGSLTLMDGVRIVLLGASGYYLSSLFDFYGLESISAGLERLILYLYPTLVLVFQACATRRLPAGRTVQAMGICYLGLGIAFVHDLGTAGQGITVATGSAWVFASAVTYALYYLGTGAMVQRIGSLRLSGLAGGASSLLVLAHFFLAGRPSSLPTLPSGVWLNAGLMAIVSTALPIYWLALAIRRLGAVQAAAVGSLGPVMTLFASWALLDEALSVFQIGGLALVMFGVSRLKPKAAPSSAPMPAAEALKPTR
ncbi:Threonine/homoserine efflux transporter RhtA [Noviherbaspirillum humi]|uniref:Threonine/homoserine efflux transporter RhtA n=1 Tax=Noviherbaspirillum humi TaxID=1688639 RepID=A0A239LYV5_9BURK|nr:DMT family transporter [Noviherbaspirillum humi]SNT35696.1 Threonine/homoserine efflux transporter RhtA [Noviherbaspirillum humi]